MVILLQDMEKSFFDNLVGRIEKKGPQGHWLDDEKAAKYLESLKEEIAALKPDEAKDFDLPEGLGQVISKGENGEIITTQAVKMRVVRGSKKAQAFIKSAFPILE